MDSGLAPCAPPNDGGFRPGICFAARARRIDAVSGRARESAMTLTTVLIIILVIALLGGFSGRFRGPGYGYGHSFNGLIGVILIVLLILVLLRKL
jgi:hypothetical protein